MVKEDLARRLDDLRAELATIEHMLDSRVEIWRVLVYPDGRPATRIYRGSFTQPRPPTKEAD